MRLSEKTIELITCSDLGWHLRLRFGIQPTWFGLTQAQEKRAGFDVATRLGAKVFLFQFKASALTLKSGARQFKLPHHQLTELQKRVKAHRAVYYVFPLIGTTYELASKRPAFLSNTWVLDVASLPKPFPPPTTPSGTIRKSQSHYADVTPGLVTIHSDPVTLGTRSLEDWTGADQSYFRLDAHEGADGSFGSFEEFDEICSLLTPNSIGCIIPHPLMWR